MVSPDRHELTFSSSFSRQNPIPRLLPKPPAHPGRWLFFCAPEMVVTGRWRRHYNNATPVFKIPQPEADIMERIQTKERLREIMGQPLPIVPKKTGLACLL